MITKLNFNKAHFFDMEEVMVFIRPLKSKLFRVFKLPSGLSAEKEKELREVLNTICKRYHKEVWYFLIPDQETENQFNEIFHLMDLLFIYVNLDTDPVISN
ncbi:MAG TPA: hypothetical protein PKI55_06270 [Chitinophagaceae bacterium]|nr:hypothetical protein [Chitinophagaceae bacterium]